MVGRIADLLGVQAELLFIDLVKRVLLVPATSFSIRNTARILQTVYYTSADMTHKLAKRRGGAAVSCLLLEIHGVVVWILLVSRVLEPHLELLDVRLELRHHRLLLGELRREPLSLLRLARQVAAELVVFGHDLLRAASLHAHVLRELVADALPQLLHLTLTHTTTTQCTVLCLLPMYYDYSCPD